MTKSKFPRVVPLVGGKVRIIRPRSITEAVVQGRRVYLDENGTPEVYIVFLPCSVGITSFHYSCRSGHWHIETIDGFEKVSVEIIG